MTTPYTATQSDLYKDTTASIEQRVNDLIGKMTLGEKVGQMSQLDITLINTTGKQQDVELNKSKASKYILQHHVGSFLNGEAATGSKWYEYIYELQRIAVEETRLGIPIIYGIDHVHGANYLTDATLFPHNLNLAATFDTKHAVKTGEITAVEAAKLGHHWNFAPILDLGKNPRWPRIYETYGESPLVVSRMGAAYVSGLIQANESETHKMAATAKHFLGYSDPKSGWDRTPIQLSDQAIYEFHLPGFQAALEAGAQTVMVNSGEVNGVPVHASKKLLTQLLRNRLDFQGVVITDWDDIGKLVNYHHVAKNYTDATEMAINAGIDMSMTPKSLKFNKSLLTLVNDGKIPEDRIDQSVKRILTLKFELGLFEHPYPSNQNLDDIGAAAHAQQAKLAAEESIVLLKNKNSLLPISEEAKRILVMGPAANKKAELSGGWSLGWQGASEDRYPDNMHTVFSALEAEFPSTDVTLLPADAYDQLEKEALNSDLIIIAFGEEPYTEFAGNITSLEIPAEQKSLIKMAAGTGKPIIGVFVGGRPRIVSNVIEDMDAYLWSGLPGLKGGEAIANVLSGKVNPSGKLPISYPAFEGYFVPHNHKASDVYTYNADEANIITQEEYNVWEWPFGYGQSYTTFEYSDIKLSEAQIDKNEEIIATTTVTNKGKLAGKESVIWYIKDHVGSITRPVREVKHFEKVYLQPGESMTVSFTIKPDKHLSFPDSNGDLLLESGKFTIIVNEQSISFELS